MTVIKIKQQKEFSTLSNQILQDPNLSIEAIGLWSHCMSRCESWTFYITQLCKQFRIGKEKLHRIINELIGQGYAFKGQKMEVSEESKAGNRKVFSNIEYIFFPYKISPEEYEQLKKEYPGSQFKKSFRNGDLPLPDFPVPENKPLKIIDSYSSSLRSEEIEKTDIGPTSSDVSAEADALCDFFLKKIKERHPSFKDPNLGKWRSCMDLLLRVDKRDLEQTKQLIIWASEHKHWKAACLSPEKLRKCWDEMSIQMNVQSEKALIQKNRSCAIALKEKYPDKLAGFTFDDKFAINRSTGKEIPFNLPHETFKAALVSMFGGDYNVAR